MTSTTIPASQECISGYEALSSFFTSSASYASSGGSPADLSAALALMKTQELISFYTSNIETRPSFQNGVSVDASSLFSAVLRENDLSTLGKVALMNSAIEDLQQDALYFADKGQFHRSVLSGAPSDGSMS